MIVADVVHAEDTSKRERTYRFSPAGQLKKELRVHVKLDEVGVEALRAHLREVQGGPVPFGFVVYADKVKVTRQADDSWIDVSDRVEPAVRDALRESFQRATGLTDVEVA